MFDGLAAGESVWLILWLRRLGIGMAVGFIALLNLLGLANQSYSVYFGLYWEGRGRWLTIPPLPVWNRVMFYVGPLLIFLCAIRAGYASFSDVLQDLELTLGIAM